MLLAATIEYEGALLPVKLRDLSEGGALVCGENLPPVDAMVKFRREEIAVQSRVAWVHAQHAGLAFAAPLTPTDVLRHVPSPRERVKAPERVPRPGFRGNLLTPEEKEIIEQWASAPKGRLGD